MARLMDAGGGNTNVTLADGSRQMMFLGYPVVFAQVLNAVTTAQTSTAIAAFGDLRLGTTLGNRRGVAVKVSDQRYLEYDQIGILGTQRVDINVHEKGTATAAGAVIVLKTPGS
jgi:HK97 family phage major capsid protein